MATVYRDPILDELRQTRERLLAESGDTLDGLVARLQREERQSDREFVRVPDRTGPRAVVADSSISARDAQPLSRETR
jgi:hypothetical protein